MTWYYRGHDKATALDRLRSAQLIACDTESVSLNDLTCIGIGLYISPTEGFYFTVFPDADENLPMVMWKLADKSVTTIWHNGNGFDLPVLDKLTSEEGYEAPDDTNYQDTSIWGQCSGLPGALQRIGQEWLGANDLFSISDLFQENACKDMLGVPVHRVAEKCLNDCRTTWQLYEYLTHTSTPAQRDCYEVDRQLIPVLRAMQAKGIGLRKGVLEAHAARLRETVLRIKGQCEEEGFNPGSPQQVGYYLASRGNILPIRRGRIVTDEEALEGCDDPLAGTVLEYRKANKLLGTYVEPWLGADRAYTHFRLDLSTGRLASGSINSWDSVNRNLQNIPPSMREVFEPDSGTWTWADHGQIELRILAALTHDPVMVAEYKKEKPDLHGRTAAAAGVSRDAGKTGNFSMVYGASNKVISLRAKIPLDKVIQLRAGWNSEYAVASKTMTDWQYNHGDCVESAFGRKMRLPEARDAGPEHNPKAFEAHVGKCSINYRIQGTGADIMKRGILMLNKLGMDERLSLHDEHILDGVYELPQELAWIHPEIYTPFETKSGATWV